jgi:hypothetical protein
MAAAGMEASLKSDKSAAKKVRVSFLGGLVSFRAFSYLQTGLCAQQGWFLGHYRCPCAGWGSERAAFGCFKDGLLRVEGRRYHLRLCRREEVARVSSTSDGSRWGWVMEAAAPSA